MVVSDLETNAKPWNKPEFRITHYGAFDGTTAESSQERGPLHREREHAVFNNQFEGNIYARHCPDVKVLRDIMIAGWMCQPDGQKMRANAARKGLRDASGKVPTYSLESQLSYFFPHFVPFKGNESTWEDWQRRNLNDVRWQYQLDKETQRLIKSIRLKRLLEEVWTPAQRLYGELQYRGVRINREWQRKFRGEQSLQLVELFNRCTKHEWPPTGNLNSPQQVSFFLYQYLRLPKPPPAYNDVGEQKLDTTNDTYLAEIEHMHPFVSVLRDYRTAAKNFSSFLAEESDWNVDRVYPYWSMTSLVTGRPQPYRPTVVNVPRDKRYRRLIVASPGNKIISIDQSQIELRIMAFLSKDDNLLEIYRNDGDIHARTAKAIVGRDNITKEERTNAKPVNFLFNYGGSPEKARKQALAEYGLRWTPQQAKYYHSAYFSLYSGVEQYHRKIRKRVLLDGTVASLSGMEWNLEDYAFSRNNGRQEEAVRAGLNYPIQHLGAVFNIIGGLALERTAPGSGFMSVHDQWLADVPENAAYEIACEWRKEWHKMMLEFFPDFCAIVPFKLDISIGDTYGDLVEEKELLAV